MSILFLDNPITDTVSKFIVVPVLVLIFELIWVSRKKWPKEAQRIFFSWRMGIERPFSFLVIPIILFFLVVPFLIRQPFNILLFVFSVPFVIQPLLEEIIWRGFIFSSSLEIIYERTHRKNAPIHFIALLLLQSVLFTLFHLRDTAIVSTFLAGVLFGIVFVISGRSVLASSLVHLAYNTHLLLGIQSFGWK